MSELSTYLQLPLILPGPAQKHVTHNEAVEMLDERVQIAVKSYGLSTPPGGAVAGERYIVGAGATDAWAGFETQIAVMQVDGTWRFVEPSAGWIVFVLDTSEIYGFSGVAWQLAVAAGGGGGGGSTTSLFWGVNTTADSTNRLSVSAPATLLSHEGAGHQLKLNKAASAETGSVLFQSDWSGRAEFGLLGSNNFEVKVSADGASWTTALTVDGATGAMTGAQELKLTAVAQAGLRDASAAGLGALSLITDGASGLNYVYSDGSVWRYLKDDAVL
ncbi:MAG: DUF2793 domain-containing protein [Pseudomonadota bacterium]